MSIHKTVACNGLREILTWKLGVFPRKIYPDSKLRKDFGFDAVDLGDLGAALVKKFGIDAKEMAVALASETDVETLTGFLAEKLSEAESK